MSYLAARLYRMRGRRDVKDLDYLVTRFPFIKRKPRLKTRVDHRCQIALLYLKLELSERIALLDTTRYDTNQRQSREVVERGRIDPKETQLRY